MKVSRAQALAFRWRRHQLGRDEGAAEAVDVGLLDLGLQDTGGDGAAWALEVRGARPPAATDLVWAWTLRGAPHVYRRADIADVAVATAPYSEADASKRVFTAAKGLKEADIAILDALQEMARAMRRIVTKRTPKGDLSGALTDVLDDPYLRWCTPCQATHTHEQLFRLASLQAGLELEPGTSPPILRRIPDLEPPMYRHLATGADDRFDVIRNYLRYFGPARQRDVAAFLDSPVKDVVANWPEDTEPVTLTGVTTDGRSGDWFVLADDVDEVGEEADRSGDVRLLGPFDPYVQLRDRPLLVAEEVHRKDLWRTLGRPGAVVSGGEVVGTWRPRSGKGLTISFDAWERTTSARRSAIEEQAERLARFRGMELAGVQDA